jgi:hypothetical protein
VVLAVGITAARTKGANLDARHAGGYFERLPTTRIKKLSVVRKVAAGAHYRRYRGRATAGATGAPREQCSRHTYAYRAGAQTKSLHLTAPPSVNGSGANGFRFSRLDIIALHVPTAYAIWSNAHLTLR